MRRHVTLLGAASVAALTAAGPASLAAPVSASSAPEVSGSIQILFGSSGDAETTALTEAAARFTEQTGVEVDVVPAQDLTQQLTQGFAGGEPPDVFYLSPENTVLFRDSLMPYGDEIDDLDDYFPALLESYTIDDQLYCLPKDYSNLALVIDQDAWDEAGLTDDDVPTTWDELATVAETLTTDSRAGLAFSGEADRVGAFFVQNGGWYLDDEGTTATADSEEVVGALAYLQEHLEAGTFQYASQLDTGWGGEAFGSGAAAMTIEGPWIAGALRNDFPDVNWLAAPLPEGSAGPGTLTFSNCWGVAAAGNTAAAVEFVTFVSTPEEQQAFSTAFGVIPPRASLAEWYTSEQPDLAAFASDIDSARGVVTVQGWAEVRADFNSELLALAEGSVSPEDLAAQLQERLEEMLEDQG